MAISGICELPDVFYQICERLLPYDLLVTTMVSRQWHVLASHNRLWTLSAQMMHIAYEETESVMHRVINSCQHYSSAAREIADYQDKNIIFQALGRKVLIQSKIEAHYANKRETLAYNRVQNRASQILHGLSTFLFQSKKMAVIPAFIPEFEEKKKLWLSLNAKELFRVTHENHNEQVRLKNELFTLCKTFKENKPSDLEVEELFYLYEVKGLKITHHCFQSFKADVCEHASVLRYLAMLVTAVEKEASTEVRAQWIAFLIEITKGFIEQLFKGLEDQNPFTFPGYWCVLIGKMDIVIFNCFLEKIAPVLAEVLQGSPDQLNQAQIFFEDNISNIWKTIKSGRRQGFLNASPLDEGIFDRAVNR